MRPCGETSCLVFRALVVLAHGTASLAARTALICPDGNVLRRADSHRHVERRAKKLKVSEEELKLPQVTGLAACQLRERDWCNVVTAHLGGASAYTWRLAKAAQGEHVLTPPTAQGASVTGAPQRLPPPCGPSPPLLLRYQTARCRHRTCTP